jgi:TraY domain
MLATRTTLAIDQPTFRRLAEVARRNERSASAEARLAIRRHLDEISAAATADNSSTAHRGAVEVGGAAR